MIIISTLHNLVCHLYSKSQWPLLNVSSARTIVWGEQWMSIVCNILIVSSSRAECSPVISPASRSISPGVASSLFSSHCWYLTLPITTQQCSTPPTPAHNLEQFWHFDSWRVWYKLQVWLLSGVGADVRWGHRTLDNNIIFSSNWMLWRLREALEIN